MVDLRPAFDGDAVFFCILSMSSMSASFKLFSLRNSSKSRHSNLTLSFSF